MEFAILGPLRAIGAQGPIDLSAPKQRAVLAVLLLAHRGEAVSDERLIDAHLGRGPARHRGQGAPGPRLAAAAGARPRPARSSRGPPATPSRSSRGSSTCTASRRWPAGRGGRGARATRAGAAGSCATGSSCSAARRSPTSRSRGPRLAEADRLEELRVAALEERVELDLELGEARRARRGARQRCSSPHPYRERLHAQLALALYRSGRQADALAALRRARDRCVDDLGLDPGRELQELEAAILAQDPALDLRGAAAARPPRRRSPPPRPAPPAPAPPRPRSAGPRRSVDAPRCRAPARARASRLLTLTGPGGIGKTRLALELAHRLPRSVRRRRRRSPRSRPSAIRRASRPRSSTRSGSAEGEGAAPGEVLAATSAGRRQMLLVLGQLRAGARRRGRRWRAAGGRAGPQGRRRPAARALRLQGEHELAVPPLELGRGRGAVRAARPRPRRGVAGRATRERLERDLRAARRAAARDRARRRAHQGAPPAAILERLEHRLDLLSAGPRDAPARQQTLRAAIDWSYDLLEPAAAAAVRGARRVRRRLAARGGRGGVRPRDARWARGARRPQPRRPARASASRCSRPCASTRSSASRRAARPPRCGARFARGLPRRSPRRGAESACARRTSRSGWSGSTPTTRTCTPRSATRSPRATPDVALRLCDALWRFWLTRGHLSRRPAARRGGGRRAAGATADERACSALMAAGILAGEAGDRERGDAAHDRRPRARARAGLRARGPPGEQRTWGRWRCTRAGSAESVERYAEALEWATARGRPVVDEPPHRTTSRAPTRRSATSTARMELLREALPGARELGDPAHLSTVLRTLGRILLQEGRDDQEALAMLRESLVIAHELGERARHRRVPRVDRGRRRAGRRPRHRRAADGGRGGGRGWPPGRSATPTRRRGRSRVSRRAARRRAGRRGVRGRRGPRPAPRDLARRSRARSRSRAERTRPPIRTASREWS